METDASVGFSRMGYQSAYIAPDLRSGRGDILFRLVGRSPRGSEAPRDALTQRREVGFPVCCAQVTHIAVPITHAAGTRDWPKGQGVKLRKRLKPWAPRDLAARFYANRDGLHPPNWDWAATASVISEPAPMTDLPNSAPPLHVNASF